MSIQSEITRITNKRDASFTAVANKGVTVPSDSTIDDLPGLIDLIDVLNTFTVTKTLTNVTTSVDDTHVLEGNSFYMDLIPASGMTIKSVVVTMDGVDITREVFKEEFETYNVIQNLTNVESSYNNIKVMADTSFFANITSLNNGTIESVKITMGGIDITEESFKPILN